MYFSCLCNCVLRLGCVLQLLAVLTGVWVCLREDRSHVVPQLKAVWQPAMPVTCTVQEEPMAWTLWSTHNCTSASMVVHGILAAGCPIVLVSQSPLLCEVPTYEVPLMRYQFVSD